MQQIRRGNQTGVAREGSLRNDPSIYAQQLSSAAQLPSQKQAPAGGVQQVSQGSKRLPNNHRAARNKGLAAAHRQAARGLCRKEAVVRLANVQLQQSAGGQGCVALQTGQDEVPAKATV